MATITEAELAAYLKKRDEQLYSRLLLNRVFQGTVTGVFGNYPNYLVQVERNGEQHSDGNTYPVVSNWEPAIGDVCDIIWRDDKVGLAAFPISSGALGRLPSRHPYQARWYWVGSLTVSPGWTPIGYTNKTNDPGAIYTTTSQNWTIPASGTYQLSIRAGVNVNSDVVVAIYLNGFELTRGTENNAAGSINSSTLSDSWPLSKGDNLRGYVFSGASGGLRSGSNENYMAICLLSR